MDCNVEYVVIGGGGSGGGVGGPHYNDGGGGGGAGSYRTGTTPGAHPVSTSIQVGAGGGFFSRWKHHRYFGTPITSRLVEVVVVVVKHLQHVKTGKMVVLVVVVLLILVMVELQVVIHSQVQ